MKITAIKSQSSRADRFSVFVDDEFSFGLSADDLLSQRLAVGQDITSEQIHEFTQIGSLSLWLAKCTDKISKRPHSVHEIDQYLLRKGCADDDASYIIKRLTAKKLLNDQSFAEWWVLQRQKSGRSSRHIRFELSQKGVEGEIVQRALSETNDLQPLKTLVTKKRSQYSDDKKLIAYLARRGYSYADIKAVLK
jgi:regulatory protein